MNAQAMRARYLGDSVTTASPARLLTMLYDRLVLDLTVAEQALGEGDRVVAGERLVHAQAIVGELRAGLDTTAWDGGPGLAALYAFLLTEMVQANITADPARVASVRECIEPLRDAWHAAAAQLGSAVVAPAS